MTKYVYRPYHPWRHRYRREKLRSAAGRLIWLAFLACGLLAVRELGRGVSVRREFPVREISQDDFRDGMMIEPGEKEDSFGIGVEAGSGTFFWFHRKVRAEEKD